MSGFNLPDGCYESDLPGWHDIQTDVAFTCKECGHEWIEHDMTVDERGGHDVESDCPECEVSNTKFYERYSND